MTSDDALLLFADRLADIDDSLEQRTIQRLP
jgi:hypothetical protein